MSRKRKPREETERDFSAPIDITQFGTEGDPCFGKLYDLSTDECRRCGDSELCGLIFSQTVLKKRREEIEKKNRFKDLELEQQGDSALEKWVKIKKEEGLKRSEVIKLAKNTFGTDREKIKVLWKKTK